MFRIFFLAFCAFADINFIPIIYAFVVCVFISAKTIDLSSQ